LAEIRQIVLTIFQINEFGKIVAVRKRSVLQNSLHSSIVHEIVMKTDNCFIRYNYFIIFIEDVIYVIVMDNAVSEETVDDGWLHENASGKRQF